MPCAPTARSIVCLPSTASPPRRALANDAASLLTEPLWHNSQSRQIPPPRYTRRRWHPASLGASRPFACAVALAAERDAAWRGLEHDFWARGVLRASSYNALARRRGSAVAAAPAGRAFIA